MNTDECFDKPYFSLASTNEGLTWEIHRCDHGGWTQVASLADCTQASAELIVDTLNASCIEESRGEENHQARRASRQLQHAHSMIHDLFHFCEWHLQEPHDFDEDDLREMLFRSGLYLERYAPNLCDSDRGP